MKNKLFGFICFIFVGLFSPLFAQVDVPLPDGQVLLFDGFEKGNYWIWAGDDWDQFDVHKYSNGARITNKWASEGTHSLECSMDPMSATSSKSALWFYDGQNNLFGAKYLVVDVYNPENNLYKVSMAVQTTDAWNWRESERYYISKGKHTIVFDMTEFIDEMYDVRRIIFTHNGDEKCKPTTKDTSLFIDNIRYIK